MFFKYAYIYVFTDPGLHLQAREQEALQQLGADVQPALLIEQPCRVLPLRLVNLAATHRAAQPLVAQAVREPMYES